MKILFITGSLNQGGAEFQLLQLAKLFKDQGHTIEVFAITDYDFYKPFIRKNGIKYNHLRNDQGKLKRIFLTVKKIKRAQPELIISYLKVPSQVAVLAKKLSGSQAKLIVGERTSFVQPRYDRFHFNLMRFANHLTVNSLVRLNQLKKDFDFLQHKISFFPNIIDLEKFAFDKTKLPNAIFTVGFVGRIATEKNIVNLVKAIAMVYEEDKNVQLILFGDARNPTYLEEVNQLIEELNLQDVILLKGKTDKVMEAYQQIDLLCLISDYEGFSNVISEALCSGIPVITSDVEENRFLIEDGKNGFVVNHKDPESIAVGINKYKNLSMEAKQAIGNSNRVKAEELFDKNKLYDEYMKLINKLLEK